MSRATEEANTTHVKWTLPIPKNPNKDEILGEFVYRPEGSVDFLARHIWIKQTPTHCLFKVEIRDLDLPNFSLGQVVSSENMQGDIFSVMCQIQNMMNAEAIHFAIAWEIEGH